MRQYRGRYVLEAEAESYSPAHDIALSNIEVYKNEFNQYVLTGDALEPKLVWGGDTVSKEEYESFFEDEDMKIVTRKRFLFFGKPVTTYRMYAGWHTPKKRKPFKLTTDSLTIIE